LSQYELQIASTTRFAGWLESGSAKAQLGQSTRLKFD
jgi:hypothetical protein